MDRLHRVFISYHHDNDENYRKIFALRFGNKFGVITPGAVNLGDIDPGLRTETIRRKIRDEHLRDTDVTVVLVGTQTWQRKHVDWEISSSIRRTQLNDRSGLLGILLPSHPSHGARKYDKGLIPPRLHDNVEVGYAKIFHWSNDPETVQQWINAAYSRSISVDPTNARELFRRNRTAERWDA